MMAFMKGYVWSIVCKLTELVLMGCSPLLTGLTLDSPPDLLKKGQKYVTCDGCWSLL